MTDLERYEAPSHPETMPAVSDAELDVYMRQAELLAQSDIIPKEYRRKPANIFVAALTGRTFGWDALTALRNGHGIEGTWSIKPEAMLALVRRAGHSVTGEITASGAVARGRRCDTGDEMTVEFTMDDARRAGLAGKSNWKQYPQSMCWARAVSQLCRMLFADVTLGLSYTPEELGADVNGDGEVVDSHRPAPVAAIEEAPYISAVNVEAIKARCAENGVNVAQVVTLGTQGRTSDPAEVYKSEIPAVRDALSEVAEATQETAEDAVLDLEPVE